MGDIMTVGFEFFVMFLDRSYSQTSEVFCQEKYNHKTYETTEESYDNQAKMKIVYPLYIFKYKYRVSSYFLSICEKSNTRDFFYIYFSIFTSQKHANIIMTKIKEFIFYHIPIIIDDHYISGSWSFFYKSWHSINISFYYFIEYSWSFCKHSYFFTKFSICSFSRSIKATRNYYS